MYKCLICEEFDAWEHFLCSFCKKKGVITDSQLSVEDWLLEKFQELREEKKKEIVTLIAERLRAQIRYGVISEFRMQVTLGEYVQMALRGIELNIPLNTDMSILSKITYTQYSSPKPLD